MQEGCTQGGPWWCRTVVASCQRRTIEGRREGGCFPAHDPSSEGRAPAVGSTLAALPRRPSGGSRLLNRTDKEARSLLLPPELRGRDRELRGCGGGGARADVRRQPTGRLHGLSAHSQPCAAGNAGEMGRHGPRVMQGLTQGQKAAPCACARARAGCAGRGRGRAPCRGRPGRGKGHVSGPAGRHLQARAHRGAINAALPAATSSSCFAKTALHIPLGRQSSQVSERCCHLGATSRSAAACRLPAAAGAPPSAQKTNHRTRTRLARPSPPTTLT